MTDESNPTPVKINEFVLLPVESVEPNGYNPNVMSDADFGKLVRRIRDMGFDEPIQVVRRGDRFVVVGGEHRLHASKVLGLVKIPAVVYDWDDREMMAECVRRNLLRGALDHGKFGGLLAEYLQGAGSIDWKQVADGFSVGEQDILKAIDRNDALKDLVKATRPADAPPKSAPAGDKKKDGTPRQATAVAGDIWELGDGGHLIACGNPSDEAALENLIGDNRAALILVDPPHMKKGWGDEASGAIKAFSKYALQKAAWYVWCGHDGAAAASAAMEEVGITPHQHIVWKLPSAAQGRTHYPVGHDLCIYGFKEEPVRRMDGVADGSSSLWEFGYDGDAGGGWAIRLGRPVRSFEVPMLVHTEPGALCLCAFPGGGSAVVAGERVGRRVAAVDPSPEAVDLAVARWQEQAGARAKCLTRPNIAIISADEDAG